MTRIGRGMGGLLASLSASALAEASWAWRCAIEALAMVFPMNAAGITPGSVAAVAKLVRPAPALGATVFRNPGAVAVLIASVMEGLGPNTELKNPGFAASVVPVVTAPPVP